MSTMLLSYCCNATVRVEGDVTQCYVCSKCGKACDCSLIAALDTLKLPDIMSTNESDELCRFLKMLDEADVNVSDWEAAFIESNLEREHFSAKQRESIMEMIEKYGRRIGYV